MFSVVVRGSWLIMEVVSGHVAYAALLCVLKPKNVQHPEKMIFFMVT